MSTVTDRPDTRPALDATDAGPVGGGYVPPDAPAVAERESASTAGVPWLVAALVAVLAGGGAVTIGIIISAAWLVVVGTVLFVAAVLLATGFYVVSPNQAAVLTLFGDYRGSDRTAGLRLANPLYGKAKVSLRIRNFNTSTSKVNDANGNPIHIAAVVVWQVVDSARAAFAVDDFVDYVHVQSESAVRQMARAYPYESFDDEHATTLIGEPGEVNDSLLAELAERADAAGVRVIEARVTDLSYASEVAEAMLRRQQAAAIVAGRAKIVEGAVGMVRQALASLEEGDGDQAVRLDPDRRATFAANLMTVIASDSPTNPVVNVGADSR